MAGCSKLLHGGGQPFGVTIKEIEEITFQVARVLDVHFAYRMFESTLDFAYILPWLLILPLIYKISYLQGIIVVLNSYFFLTIMGNITSLLRLYRSKPIIRRSSSAAVILVFFLSISVLTNNLDPETTEALFLSKANWIYYAGICLTVFLAELGLARKFIEPSSL